MRPSARFERSRRVASRSVICTCVLGGLRHSLEKEPLCVKCCGFPADECRPNVAVGKGLRREGKKLGLYRIENGAVCAAELDCGAVRDEEVFQKGLRTIERVRRGI